MYRKLTRNQGIWNAYASKIWLIMRLTAAILLTALMQVFAVNGSAQKITLSESNTTLKSVLKELKKQSGYNFLSTDNLLDQAYPVNITVSNTEFKEVLERIFSNQPLTYEIKEGTIVLHEKESSFFSKILSQLKVAVVNGRVTDTAGRPIGGVTVRLKGSSRGVITDADGNFQIEATGPESVLIFSSVNYKTVEITVGNQDHLSIVLKEAILNLKEIQLISTGYQRLSPIQSTGSIAVIREKDYNSRINTTDFLLGLQNKIPGLLINNDIKFEGNNLFQIRGISTIKGNKQPLIVVDGYPTELTLEMINPYDIESVTVLKDAAAAAIYGARSSNGVIIVERKKARVGKVQVHFRATTSLTPKENYERYRWDKNGSSAVIDYYRAVSQNSINANTWNNINSLTNGAFYNYQTPGLIIAQQKAGVITPAQADAQFAALGAYNNADDYARLFLRTAVSNVYNLDLSGGSKDVLYYLSSNYIDTKSTQIENGKKTWQLSGRGTFNFSDRFSLALTNNFMQTNTNGAPVPDINSLLPYERLQDDKGNPLPVFNGSNASPYYNKALIAAGLQDNMYYPLVDVHEINNDLKTISNRFTADFNYKINRQFNFTFGGVYELSRGDSRSLASENSSVTRQLINRYTSGPATALVFNLPKGGFLKQQFSSTQGYTLRAQLNFNQTIKQDHVITAILGSEVRGIITQSNASANFGYNDQTLTQQAVNYQSLFVNGLPATYAFANPRPQYTDLFNILYEENRYVSAYSNLAYTYKGKYSATGSIRVDQSNLFGTDPKYRYRPLWSVGAAWNMDREDFIKTYDWINTLKMRVAYGFNGNVAKNSLPEIIASNGVNNFDSNIPILYLSSPANRGLRWEQTHNFNTGVDFNLFKNIGGSFDYYVKTSVDLLAAQQVDPTRGVQSALINQASIRNQGFEISLNADWITHPGFNWNTGFAFSRNTSKVLQVYSGNVTGGTQYVTGVYSNYLQGYPVGALFSYHLAGVDNTGFPTIYGSDGKVKRITSNDRDDDVSYAGTAIPSLNFGLSNRIDYKSFYVYAMVNYYGGNKIRKPVPTLRSGRPLEGASNYWKKAGDENIPDILPAANYRDYDPYVMASDRYTMNGAYVTLGDVTFAYNMKNDLVKKIGLNAVEFKAQASNVYTKGFNKDNYSLATGSYAKSYITPTYTLAVNINFK
ncbi:SusC/RagA family TonB-linked outer membrane protein [Mucilaginibacter ximonensis]|uniref:SusC/RagA family TonB-linked outer membrane protein n=1 Tax=Mucilaginibacter ximonensis TaxID=538021 RepID=A0ABW5YA91_9SPHI